MEFPWLKSYILIVLFNLSISTYPTLKGNGESQQHRSLDIQGWFSNPVNTIIFILGLLTFIILIFVLLLVYKMNPKCRNWFKGLFRKKEIVIDEETKERDYQRYLERK